MTTQNDNWLWEYLTPDLAHGTSFNEVLFTGRTQYQQVDILDTSSYGRCLILDGKLQSAEADEFIYHEALVHPLLITHPNPRKVLVAGGGEGATIREVLAHNTVDHLTMVDLDAEVVELCQRHLPLHHQGSFEDPRLQLHIADALGFLEQDSNTYDAIILDLPDPLEEGPAYLLYTQEFYKTVSEHLTHNGLIVVQAGSALPTLYRDAFAPICRTLSSIFPMVAAYRGEVASFGGLWGFAIASHGLDPRTLDAKTVNERMRNRVRTSLKFYDGITHEGIFRLPQYLRHGLAEEKRISTKAEPLFVF